jgi:hypothetical protein
VEEPPVLMEPPLGAPAAGPPVLPAQPTAIGALANSTRTKEYVFEMVFMVAPKVADGSTGIQ